MPELFGDADGGVDGVGHVAAFEGVAELAADGVGDTAHRGREPLERRGRGDGDLGEAGDELAGDPRQWLESLVEAVEQAAQHAGFAELCDRVRRVLRHRVEHTRSADEPRTQGRQRRPRHGRERGTQPLEQAVLHVQLEGRPRAFLCDDCVDECAGLRGQLREGLRHLARLQCGGLDVR